MQKILKESEELNPSLRESVSMTSLSSENSEDEVKKHKKSKKKKKKSKKKKHKDSSDSEGIFYINFFYSYKLKNCSKMVLIFS